MEIGGEGLFVRSIIYFGSGGFGSLVGIERGKSHLSLDGCDGSLCGSGVNLGCACDGGSTAGISAIGSNSCATLKGNSDSIDGGCGRRGQNTGIYTLVEGEYAGGVISSDGKACYTIVRAGVGGNEGYGAGVYTLGERNGCLALGSTDKTCGIRALLAAYRRLNVNVTVVDNTVHGSVESAVGANDTAGIVLVTGDVTVVNDVGEVNGESALGVTDDTGSLVVGLNITVVNTRGHVNGGSSCCGGKETTHLTDAGARNANVVNNVSEGYSTGSGNCNGSLGDSCCCGGLEVLKNRAISKSCEHSFFNGNGVSVSVERS